MALIITNRNDADRFSQAMKMIEEGNHLIEEGHRTVRELSDQMRLQYGERGTRGDRDGDGRYNERIGEPYPQQYDQRFDPRFDPRYDQRYPDKGGWPQGGTQMGYRDPMGRY